MKKFLPLILFFVGILVVGGAYFVIKNKNAPTESSDEGQILSVPLDKRPVLSLTPREKGHWLDMKVQKISIKDSDTMEYLLVYSVADPDGGTREQGVPGQVQLSVREVVEAPLLLGSESKGVYRYDEGVKKGTLTLKFRNKDGKLITKFVADFSMDMNVSSITSADSKFKVNMSNSFDDVILVMNTIGYPGKSPAEVVGEPYGLFIPSNAKLPGGTVDLSGGKIYRYDGSNWTNQVGGDSLNPGVYVTTK
jgi:hypothetical protein